MGPDLERRNRYKVSLTGKSQIGFWVSRGGGGSSNGSGGDSGVGNVRDGGGGSGGDGGGGGNSNDSNGGVDESGWGSGVWQWSDKGGWLASGREGIQERGGCDLRAEDFRTTLPYP